MEGRKEGTAMTRILFAAICGWILFRYTSRWERIVGIVLVVTVTVGLVFPSPAYAQFGLLESIQNILNLINGAIRSALNVMATTSQSLQARYQHTVWPPGPIDQARNTIAALITEFRAAMQSIHRAPVNSATLPAPAGLEAIMRNRQTNDFANLTQSFYEAFGTLPPGDEADGLARNMIDMDDGLALNTLKTLKATEQAGDLILESGDRIEDEARAAAPGSAPLLSAAAMAALIQSQAMMQKMLATMLRQEAGRIAHENGLRKRQGIVMARVRQDISDVLRR
jgi:hypothetical protein